jgi:hypothetical protein
MIYLRQIVSSAIVLVPRWSPTARKIAGPVSLPALEMPSLETVLSAEGILCNLVGTEEEQTDANAI